MEVLDKVSFNSELEKRIAAKEKALGSGELKNIEKERIEWQISGMKLISGMANELFAKEIRDNKVKSSLKTYRVTFEDGKSEVVSGEVRLFYSNAIVQLTAVPGINYFNIDNVLSVKPIDSDEKVISKKNHLCDGMKINKTALNIRSEIVESRIEHLKDITPEQLESLVQLFEKENNRKLISDMSLQRKIDALGLAPIDSKVYNEHLKHMESIGVGVRHFKYYKLHGQTFMPYSQEYLLGNSIECLLKRDKENYKRLCPLFFGRLKRRIDRWGRR